MTEFRRIHSIIHGQVQGVGYRNWTRRSANELGLTGWVKNLPDGTVEVLIEGREDAVTKMQHRFFEGPPLAAVREVHAQGEESGETQKYNLFEILR